VITGLKVLLDPKSEVRREIALDVIGQLPLDLIAIDFYETRFARHEHHRSMGCRDGKKETLAVILARQLSFETFVTLLNPTAT
jgi:formate-dependent phosphoribosylglycinamide formyltransferase (GAR transformylase)